MQRIPALCVAFLAAAVSLSGFAAESNVIEMGPLKFNAPAKFKAQRPRSDIIAYEFASPPAEGDEQGGRLTVMAAGGSIDQNIERWYTQFTQPDGSSTKKASKVEKEEVQGLKVHLVDIPGTFIDKPAPFAPGPGVKRENYRMLGAIVESPEGNVFFKFYGPEKTIAQDAEAFREMITGLKKS